LISPTASIGAGAFFTPSVGARLHVNAWESEGGFRSIENHYKFNYVNTNADLLINLTNLFSKKKYHTFNLILVGGVGLNYAWNNDDLDAILATQTPAESTCNAWGEGKTRENLLSHNLRVGLLADVNLAKHWSLGVEVDMNSLDDRFNSKYNNSDDWMLTAQLSLTYKFGFKKTEKKSAPVAPVAPAPVVEEKKEEPAPVVEEKKEEPKVTNVVVKVKDEPLKETLFYDIRGAEINPESVINSAAAWGKKYPNKKIVVSGYADKGTGNSKVNMEYAEKRVEKVVSSLKSKGIPASQIESKAYGDSVQPYAENDKNRCVIIEGK
jgi:outer membrane protein OmpA-like peptidoglycan-associated protein